MADPIKLPSILNTLASQGSNQQDVASARDQMAIQLAPQEAGINSTIQQIQQYLDRDIQTQQQYGQVADQKISEVGSQLAQQLGANVGAIGNIYQSGVQQVGNIYDQGIQATQAAGSSIRDRLSQSATALGQTQALKADPYGADPISRLMAQQASQETRLIGGKAGSQANLAQLGTSLQGIAQKAVGDSEREYAQKRSDIATDVLKTISQLQLAGQAGVMEQLQKYSILAETAGPMFRTLIGQAANARSEAERQQAKDSLDAMAKIAQINKDNASAQRESDPNSLDNQLKRLNIGLKTNELEETTGAPKYISESQGQQQLTDFLDGIVRSGRGDTTPGLITGPQHAGIKNFINQNTSKISGIYNTTDPVAILTSLAQNSVDSSGQVKLPVTSGSQYSKDYKVDLPTLLSAIQARYQYVGPKVGTRVK